MRNHRLLLVLAAGLFAGAPGAQAGQNLIDNGSFDDGLRGWKYKYDLPGESLYADNHTFVSVIPSEDRQRQVLQLDVSYGKSQGAGVKVDSAPVPVDIHKRYKLTVSAKTTGPNCRILFEGYKWKPGIKPHDNPQLHELRKIYKFVQVFFSPPPPPSSSPAPRGRRISAKEKGGDFGGVGRVWSSASMTFPDPQMSPLAREKYEEVEFVVLHVIAMGGGEGKLFVDDVQLEKLP